MKKFPFPASDLKLELIRTSDAFSRLKFMADIVPKRGSILVDTLVEVSLLAALHCHGAQHGWKIVRADFSDATDLLRQLTQHHFDVLYVTTAKAVPTEYELHRLIMIAGQFQTRLVVASSVWSHKSYVKHANRCAA